MSESSPDHENNRASYWRGETNARLKAVEDGQRDLRGDIKTAGEMTRLAMAKNSEELSKAMALFETRMETRFTALDARITTVNTGLDDVKKEVYRMLGKAAVIAALLVPFIFFLLQRLFPVKP